jgi:tRNA pseudouridine65 synthase
VIINKPSGLLVHRSPIDPHETRFALQLLRDQLGKYVYPVHRLDKPTSGALIFALSREVAKKLSDSFARQEISKTYVAIVRGYAPEQATVNHPLTEKFDKLSDKKSNKAKSAQEALTHVRRLATVELPYCVDRYPQSRYSLVVAQPVSGRKHQIRRHLKHIGHPIIGDAKHGKGIHNRFFQSQFDCHRLLLACIKLEFDHPLSGEQHRFSSQFPERICVKANLDGCFKDLTDDFEWAGEINDATNTNSFGSGKLVQSTL